MKWKGERLKQQLRFHSKYCKNSVGSKVSGGWGRPPSVIGLHRSRTIIASAQQAEDVEEEVDEVEIEDKATHQCDFHGRLFVCLAKLMHEALDFLGVISRESCER